ncbi:hypothetical protein DPSP01_008449 [Paraphaeosphaeria sporulosa]
MVHLPLVVVVILAVPGGFILAITPRVVRLSPGAAAVVVVLHPLSVLLMPSDAVLILVPIAAAVATLTPRIDGLIAVLLEPGVEVVAVAPFVALVTRNLAPPLVSTSTRQ